MSAATTGELAAPRRARAGLPLRIATTASPIVFGAWAIGAFSRGERRWEHLVFLVLAPALAWGTPRMRRLFAGVLPLLLLGLVYDTMRLVKNIGVEPSRVHTCDIRALEARLFGVHMNGALVPPHDWLQAHASTALDLYFAIPYGTFIYVAVAFGLWLYVRDYDAMRTFGWTFLVVNLAGFVTYHIVPAAPPWYVHAHGCVVDLAAHASPGPNLARVDAMLGTPYFQSFYGRSSDVFGAVPSLHVAYPLLVVLFGWPLFETPLRVASSVFFASMCVAAVYLDHHWIVDVLLGVTYTLIVFTIVRVRARAATRGARIARPA